MCVMECRASFDSTEYTGRSPPRVRGLGGVCLLEGPGETEGCSRVHENRPTTSEVIGHVFGCTPKLSPTSTSGDFSASTNRLNGS